MYLPISRHAAELVPVTLMRLTEVDDADEVLKDHRREDIVVEPKLDGWKAQVIKTGGKISIYSRSGEDVTGNFPSIVKELENLPDGTLVEGELTYWDKGKQDVTKVTSLAGSSADKAVEKAKSLPGEMRLYLYDILWHKGNNVAGKPFSDRRKLLESAVKVSDIVKLTEQYPFSEWQNVMNSAVKKGGEGIVLKLKGAKYQWKPKGENEPKPADTMWKYKGGAGKHDSDDYVVYGTTRSKTGKLMAQFGQYHKGKLYAISEIDNFSEENEAEIKKHLEKGLFVIEIGFQERVPGGLRHQKFLRFRDDKKPKDATMHEFHVEHIDEFKPAEISRKAMFAFAGIPDPNELVTALEGAVDKKPQTVGGIGNIGGVDGDKMFRIMSKLESGGRTDTVGDAGTSFGPTQVHGPYLLSKLSRMPGAQAATTMSPEEMKELSKIWLDTIGKLKKVNIWKTVPVNPKDIQGLSPVRRMEKTFIRRPDMVVEKRGDGFVGRVIDTSVLRNLGFDTDSETFKRILERVYEQYITDNVALSSLTQAYLSQMAPTAFQKFRRQFNSASIRKNKALSNLLEKASMADFTSRINAVVDMLRKSGYDTSAPGAFNPYQLIVIANASGVGRVQQFLLNRKPFGKGNLHYIQSSRYRQALEALKKTEPDLAGIANAMLAGIPSNGGTGGFPGKVADRIAAFLGGKKVCRTHALKMALAETHPISSKERPDYVERASGIIDLVKRWLNYDIVRPDDLRSVGLTLMRIDRSQPQPKLMLWTVDDPMELGWFLPSEMWGMPIVLNTDVRKTHEPVGRTQVDVESRMPPNLFGKYKHMLKQVRDILESEGRQVPEDDLRRTVFLEVAERAGIPKEKLKKMIGEHAWLRFSRRIDHLRKEASENTGTLAFPGNFAQDIKSGKMERTIRLADMPVAVDEVVRAVTYSGGDICRIKILSKETMSLPRIEKSFGKHVARSLEHKFGPNRRYVVIRFCRFENKADDGDLDEKKRGEVLIDKDGVKLTRGQIYDHYAKPIVRKQIMSRIKSVPVLIYLGVGKNEKILKRNHDDKSIVIENDEEKNSDSPNNYWYWVKRRMLAIHEVFGTKTDIGFVDLDLHGGYSLDKAKEYARKASSAIKEKYGVPSKIYQSGGTGLHIEFKLGEKVGIDGLRKELRALLDKLNEDFEGATTSTVKGKGMRTDVSTLHNKGSLRVPGSLGETWGKVKKPLSQNTDDDYGNNNFGGKDSDTGPFGDGGAITPMPYQSSAQGQPGIAVASLRLALFRDAGKIKRGND